MAPILKEEWEIEIMREAGRIVAESIEEAKKLVLPGIKTIEIDRAVEEFIRSKNAYPTFKGYHGFPRSTCISINEEVVHGIPTDRVLQEGDIVSLDVGATYKNYVGDMAQTVPVGRISERAAKLIEITKNALYEAIKVARPYGRLYDISNTIQNYVESRGYSVVRKFVGHGIGTHMHEDPQVPNYVISPIEKFDIVLKPGIVIAIEPMVNEGTFDVKVLENNWTVVTKDGKLSAHFEHTVAIGEKGAEILTMV